MFNFKNFSLVTILCLSCITPVYCDKAYVACTNGKDDYHYLTWSNGDYIAIEGKWCNVQITYIINNQFKTSWVGMFLRSDGQDSILQACTKEYVPQPVSTNVFDRSWYIFDKVPGGTKSNEYAIFSKFKGAPFGYPVSRCKRS